MIPEQCPTCGAPILMAYLIEGNELQAGWMHLEPEPSEAGTWQLLSREHLHACRELTELQIVMRLQLDPDLHLYRLHACENQT